MARVYDRCSARASSVPKNTALLFLNGGSGNDEIVADDRESDTVDGGADYDRAFVDAIDPVSNVEEAFVR